MKKVIEVNVGEEYQVKIAEYPDEKDFFFPAYIQAARELQEIIHDTKSYYNTNKDTEKTSIDYSNNIIAFNGGRGQGKSSAMLSFSNFLRNCTKDKNRDFFKKEQADINDAKFIILDRIDPTKIEKNENILTIILAKLFLCFSNQWEKNQQKNVNRRGEILQLFENCYSEIEAIKYKEKQDSYFDINSLEKLKKIGDSENLKKDFLNLICQLLDFSFGNEHTGEFRNQYLVIQLDDTDLDVERAQEIVEDVRKYFMIPNVVILMAVDVDQLTFAIEQGFIKQFEKLQSNYSELKPINYHRIAVKYIDKLIPGKRNILLPKLRAASRETPEIATLKYYNFDHNNTKNNILNFNDINGNQLDDIQELLLRYIYQKTGLIFVKPTNYLHYIVPRTMRGLVNFLSILHEMKDVQLSVKNDTISSVDELSDRLNNIELFEDYFTATWIPNHIVAEYRDIVESFIETPWTIKSKQLVRDLRNKFIRNLIVEESTPESDLKQLFDESVNSKSDEFTLAYVRDILSKLENIYPNQDLFMFLFAIRTLYSINASKMVCNILISELQNNSSEDLLTLFHFYGGDLFGKTAQEFLRSEKGKYNRAVFDIRFSKNSSEYKHFEEIMADKNNARTITFFLNFIFDRSTKTKEYLNQLKSQGNNALCKHISFNVAYALLNLFQPKLTEKKINAEEIPPLFASNMIQERLTCINIISSMDLLNRIENELKDYSLMRSQSSWGYEDYLNDFFTRIEESISRIKYLPLTCSFYEIKNKIKAQKYDFIFLFEIYKKSIPEKLPDFKQIKGTKTFEDLKRQCKTLKETIAQTGKQENIDFSAIFNSLDMLIDQITLLNGDMSDKDREIYQGSYNKIIKEINQEIEDQLGF